MLNVMNKYKRKAFTLIEIIIVLAIIGILLTGLSPIATGYLRTTKKVKLEIEFNTVNKAVRSAVVAYENTGSSMPYLYNITDESAPYFPDDVYIFNIGWRSTHSGSSAGYGGEMWYELEANYHLMDNFMLTLADFWPEDIKLIMHSRPDSFWNADELDYTTTTDNFAQGSVFPSSVSHANLIDITLSGINYKLYYTGSNYLESQKDHMSVSMIFEPNTSNLQHVVLYKDGYYSIDGGEPIAGEYIDQLY